MSQINFCSQCGAPLTDANANFCSQCGHKFAQPEEVANTTPQTEAQPHADVLPQERTVKNPYYLKYLLSTGISGILISAFAATLALFILRRFLVSGTEYELGDTSCNYLPNNFLFIIPVLFGFYSFKQLRNFANTQVIPETKATIRKISLCVLMIIIGGVINIYGSQITFEDGILILLSLTGLAGCILGLVFTSIIVHKARSLYSSDSNINNFMQMTKKMTFISAILLATSFLLEFSYKCSVLYGVSYYEMTALPIISTIIYIVVYLLILIISIRFIITLRKNVPLITAEELNGTEQNSMNIFDAILRSLTDHL